jgi:hypothetical protein
MIPFFSGLFPLQARRAYCARHLKKGVVLRFLTQLTHPPKIKRVVVWGFDESLDKIGLSFINTDISNIRNTYFQGLQYHLPAKGRDYLDHDSYLDCSKIYETCLEEVRNLLVDDPRRHLGDVSSGDLSAASKLIVRATTIEPKLKKRYGFI